MIDVNVLFLVGWAVGWFLTGVLTGRYLIPPVVDIFRGRRAR